MVNVNVVCRNPQEDRIIPRMARALSERLGWTLTMAPDPSADLIYLSAYFEVQTFTGGRWPDRPIGAYLTHREEEPPGNDKAKLFDSVAKRVNLRVCTAKLYADMVRGHGPTVQARPPLEIERFTIARPPGGRKPVVGLSGWTYKNHRKGEDLLKAMLASPIAQKCEWKASGRNWPVPTKMYAWRDMPGFYQSLDVLVCTSRVEGIPMPPLEALACGVRVVIPRGVGLFDELPDVPGICRYDRGDLAGLLRALEEAAYPPGPVSRVALRQAVEGMSAQAFCSDVGRAMLDLAGPQVDGGLAEAPMVKAARAPVIEVTEPVQRETNSKRGIYCVAFGDPARKCALRMMTSAKRHMPDIPIALCAAKAIGPEDVLIIQEDSDIGGRRAKLKAYELSPAEWEAVLYLDADTEVTAPIYQYWRWIEDGWEFVICKDPHLMDTMHAFERKNNKRELLDTGAQTKTLHAMQWNGGVWAFGRNERVARFFQRWQVEWERYAQRDQGALVRAMYAEPLKIWLLGNEWNTFEKYTRGITTAGLMHYPGDARRWGGLIPGRIDSPEAWAAVQKWESEHRGKKK